LAGSLDSAATLYAHNAEAKFRQAQDKGKE